MEQQRSRSSHNTPLPGPRRALHGCGAGAMAVRVGARLALIASAAPRTRLPSGCAVNSRVCTHATIPLLQGTHARVVRRAGATRAEHASQGRTAALLLWLAVVALYARDVAPQVANFTIALSSAQAVAPKSRYSPSVMGVNMGACAPHAQVAR